MYKTKLNFLRFLSREKTYLQVTLLPVPFFIRMLYNRRTYLLFKLWKNGNSWDIKERRIPPAEKRTPTCTSIYNSVKKKYIYIYKVKGSRNGWPHWKAM